MKKLFTLLTLALLSIGTAWADVTVGRTLPSTSQTDYTLSSIANTTVTIADGTGESGTEKETYHGSSTKNKYKAKNYRDKKSSAVTAYNSDVYAGYQLAVANGYKFTASKINVDLSVSQNFSYRVVVLDNNGNALYTSSDFTITNFNANTATNLTKELTLNSLVLGGTIQVRLYYWYTGNSGSKYLVPVTFTMDGTVETATNYTVSTAVNGDGTVTGAGSFVDGMKATLKAIPGAATFDHWSKASDGSWSSTDNPLQVAVTADETYTAHFAAATTHTITGEIAAGQSSYGSITNAGDNEVVEDETITFAATANEGYAFVNWKKDGVDYSTDASITVTSTADATYTANFKKLFTVTYDIADYKNTTTKALNNYNAGNSINEKYAAANDKYTIPSYSHYYMYREGYIFSKWKDQDEQEYEKGTEITLTKDITLTPVWVATTQTLANSSEEATVTWNFGKSTILFNGWQNSPQIGYYTKPCTINGELIAVPMIVDATSGKVDNSSRTDALAQVNGGTKFTIPAIKGMTVVLTANSNITNTTVAGNTPSSGSGTKTATYNYTGENGTADIVIADGSYYQKIAVTYPAMTIAKAITAAEWATLVPSAKVSVPAGVKAYTVTAANSTTATLSAEDAITVIPADEPVLINGAEGTYYFPKTADAASDVTGNLLQTGAVASADGSQYILANGGSGVGFYKATAGTAIAAGKAYLVSPSDAPFFLFNLGSETTGINVVKGEGFTVNGEVYDLQGRKVAKPTKGLYIVNGKKVMIK